jgi:hypothetical protein
MFRFDALKPEIREVIQERQVSKEALRHVFFYSLLELERLRNHLFYLDSEIDYEGDLYLLMNLGERRGHTCESIERRRELTRNILPVIIRRILDEYMKGKEIDRWDQFILYDEKEIEHYLSGMIAYDDLVKRTVFQCNSRVE